MPRERREQVVALHEFLLELRNRRFVRRKLALQAQYVRIGHRPGVRLDLGDSDLLLLQLDELCRCLDLGAISSLGDHGIDDVGRQGEIRCPLVGMGHIDFGVQSFDQTPLPAEDIECVADGSRQRE